MMAFYRVVPASYEQPHEQPMVRLGENRAINSGRLAANKYNGKIMGLYHDGPRYTMMATAMKTWRPNGVLLRNRQIHDIVG